MRGIVLEGILFGQFLSLLTVASTFLSNSVAEETQAAISAVPSVTMYVLMFCFSIPCIKKKSHCSGWWLFALFGLADAIANMSIHAAFFFAGDSLVKIGLLEDAAVPFAYILDRRILKRLKTAKQTLGAIICFLAISFYTTLDHREHSQATQVTIDARKYWAGIALPLLSALAYTISNALQCYIMEEMLKNKHPASLKQVSRLSLHKLGLWGTIFSFLLGLPLFSSELCTIKGHFVSAVNALSLSAKILGTVFALLAFYCLIPRFLRTHTATFLNMSLMTRNAYMLIGALAFLRQRCPWYAFVAYGLVFCSLLLFKSDGVDAGCANANASKDNKDMHV